MTDGWSRPQLPQAAAGFRLEHLGRVGSSNDEALQRARAGDPGRVWIIADEQDRGRGRNGRTWVSPVGNLFASLLVVAPCAMAVSPQLGFVAGVALHEALATLTGLQAPRLALKWPNDLLLDGAKLAGILVEGTTVTSSAGGSRLAVVIGCGVNVVDHPPDTPYAATDCRSAGFPLQRDDVFERLAGTLAGWLDRWDAGHGFAGVRQAWLAAAGGLGGPVVVRRPEGDLRGLFRDIDAQGQLLLEQDGRVTVVQAGDVFLGDIPGTKGEMMAADRRGTL